MLVSILPLLLAGCQLATDSPTKPDGAEENKKTNLPPVPTPTVEDLAVDRRQLLLAVNEAASAAALGIDDGSQQSSLMGRQFILRIPIGCDGESDATTGFIYDEDNQRLTLKAVPELTLADVDKVRPVPEEVPAPAPSAEEQSADDSAAIGGADANSSAVSAPTLTKIEAVNGFWISRPWILAESCPIETEFVGSTTEDASSEGPKADDKYGVSSEDEPTSNGIDETPNVAIAHFFTARDPRVGRRDGSAYRITKRVTEDERPDPKSLRLVLRGRLGQMPDGKTIQCSKGTAKERPRCIISASFDRVSFENANGSIVYAQWGGG